ncbi:hypothetical protein D7Y22_02455 [Stenotrophomonas maltophilia]|nr:hypothetical protein [Stenotrophomonas maltophilia]
MFFTSLRLIFTTLRECCENDFCVIVQHFKGHGLTNPFPHLTSGKCLSYPDPMVDDQDSHAMPLFVHRS